MQCKVQKKWTPELDKRQGVVCHVVRPDAPLGFREYQVSRDQLGGLHLQRMAETTTGSFCYHWRLVATLPSGCDCGCGGYTHYGNPHLKRAELDELPAWAAPHVETWRTMPLHRSHLDEWGQSVRPPVVVMYGGME